MNLINEQLQAIVGKDNVISDPEGLAAYGGDNISFITPRLPLMAARPGSVEELQAVMKAASLSKIPVTPFSSSGHGHGASIQSVPGLTIDLRRLNRVHDIDTMYRNAVIEPGVTFAQLQKTAEEKGLRTLTPIEIPAEASVVSTYLEMTPLYAWPKYGTETILTMEVLLPNGEILKTGMAAIPVIDKPYFPFGTNPSYFNKVWFGAQGTLGIVTKAIIKLKTNFEDKHVFFVPFEAFEQSFAAIKELKRLDSAVEFFLADATYLAGLLLDDAGEFTELKEVLPPVTAVLVLRGTKEQIAYQSEDLGDLAKEMNFELLESLPGKDNAAERILTEMDLPAGYERFKEIKGAYGVIPFICMAKQIPLFNRVAAQIAGGFGYDRSTIGSLLVPAEPSRVHFQYSFYLDPTQPQEYMLGKKLFEVLSGMLIKMGGFFSRPYGDWAAQVYAKAGPYKNMLKEIKNTVDPDNIMNPGKLNL